MHPLVLRRTGNAALVCALLATRKLWFARTAYKGYGTEKVDIEHLTPLIDVSFGYLFHTEHCSMIHNKPIKSPKFFDRTLDGMLGKGEIVKITSHGSNLARMISLKSVQQLCTASEDDNVVCLCNKKIHNCETNALDKVNSMVLCKDSLLSPLDAPVTMIVFAILAQAGKALLGWWTLCVTVKLPTSYNSANSERGVSMSQEI